MQPPQTSRVPAVVDALVAAVKTALPGVQVLDGPRTAEELAPDVVAVGFGLPSVDESQVPEPGLGNAHRETVTVSCTLSSWSGDTDMKARRDRCGVMLAAVESALRADLTLGGVVDQAHIGADIAWQQDQTPKGAVCEVAFQVTCVSVI